MRVDRIGTRRFKLTGELDIATVHVLEDGELAAVVSEPGDLELDLCRADVL